MVDAQQAGARATKIEKGLFKMLHSFIQWLIEVVSPEMVAQPATIPTRDAELLYQLKQRMSQTEANECLNETYAKLRMSRTGRAPQEPQHLQAVTTSNARQHWFGNARKQEGFVPARKTAVSLGGAWDLSANGGKAYNQSVYPH
jgi:hypothetical protein